MATIRERVRSDGKKSYQAIVKLQGHKPVVETFKRRTDAKKWANRTENEILEGRFAGHSEATKHTMAETIDRYIKSEIPKKSDSQNRENQLKIIRGIIGEKKLSEVTPAVIVELRDELREDRLRGKGQRSNATLNRLMAALSHVFTVAARDWQWTTENPVASIQKLKEPKGRVRYLDDEERARLLEVTKENPTLHLLVVLALSTAARRGELLGLKWKDVDLKQGRALLHQTKNGERRVLALTGYALKLLKAHNKVRQFDSELVFPNPANGAKSLPLDFIWKQARAKAELQDFRFHDLRHSAASYLAMDGASVPELAAVLGHKTLSMVKRYSHLSEDHTATVVAKMNKTIFG